MLARLNFIGRKSVKSIKQNSEKNYILATPSIYRSYSKYDEFKASRTTVHSELKEKFESVAPELIKSITEIGHLKDVPQMREYFKKLLAYNLFDGKKNRGLLIVYAHQMISSHPNEEDLKLACLLGWCVELAFYLVHDDIIDGSEFRRGRPCWYRFHENGLDAINDGVLLEHCIYVILEKYFKNKPYYVTMIEIFHDASSSSKNWYIICQGLKVTMRTSIGQVLDMQTSKSFQLKRSFNQFTWQRYSTIVRYKTAYYSFQLPVTIAMLMTGITEKSLYEKAANILLDIGQYFQIQDDFLDCYGDEKIMGKSGNDIAEGKCTWLIVNALNRANQEQTTKLQENYGDQDAEKIKSVVQIYNALDLRNEYKKIEKHTCNKLMFDIQNLPKGIPPELFSKIVNNLNGRKY